MDHHIATAAKDHSDPKSTAIVVVDDSAAKQPATAINTRGLCAAGRKTDRDFDAALPAIRRILDQ